MSHKIIQISLCMVAGAAIGACAVDEPAVEEAGQEVFVEQIFDDLPNDTPLLNAHGFAATHSTAGSVGLVNAFFTAQGTNGRHCGTCHAPEVGWSMTGPMVTAMFLATDGTHPLFASNLDTDRPTADMSTTEARWSATTMLRQGKFTRKVALPATRDYDVVDIADPFGVSTPATLFWFRRPMPTASLRSHVVHIDGQMTVGTVVRDGLLKQARANIVNGQQGAPPTDAVVGEIADYELELSHAQIYVWGAGRLDADGARGGPAHLAAQPFVAGRFDLYDAWQNSPSAKRRQIWRGQELFNNVNPPSGRRCGGCHSAANIGLNVNGTMFDIGASRPELAKPDMAVFTFQSRTTGDLVRTTDPGQGIRTGQFSQLGKFKTPNLRGLAARAPYFHGGTAEDLPAVVRHYEQALGFVFTAEEEADLVAFLKAL